MPRAELQAGVGRVAAEISAAHPDGVILVSVLKGSLLFAADLLRGLTVPAEIDFLAISSYAHGSGRVRILKDLDGDIGGRPVVLVEDIVDTGLTLTYLRHELQRRSPSSLEVCALADKAARRILPVPLDYVGFEVPDEFVIGYGLGFSGRYRNLDFVAVGDLEALVEDPDAHVQELYAVSSDR